jgi:hypothetical protein
MLPEGSPTIAQIKRLQEEVKTQIQANKADPPSAGWPDNILAIILNMIERDPSFLPDQPGRAAVVDNAAVRDARDNVDIGLVQLRKDLEKRDAKDKGPSWAIAHWTLDQMRKVLKYRDDRGGRRRTRRGRKSLRKSLRQRK